MGGRGPNSGPCLSTWMLVVQVVGSSHCATTPALYYLLLIYLAVNASSEAVDKGSSTGASAAHVGDVKRVLGSWLRASPALLIMYIWGHNTTASITLPSK